MIEMPTTLPPAVPPPPDPPVRWPSRLVAVLLLTAVGLAFADASVVTLALPALYGEFNTTIVGVSWVLTTYALAVAVTAVPLALCHRRLRPLPVAVVGAVVFAAASMVAGAASSLAVLLVARCVQGVGATLVLAGSLPLLGALIGRRRGRAAWATAATAGAAVGPALGGFLTQVFNWRAIFFVQAPVVAAALAVCAIPAARAVTRERGTRPEWRTAVANAGFALVFAALVGALFLGVLLAVEVWGYSPLAGAAVVTGVPVGMILVRWTAPLGGRVRAVVGAACLGGGLVGLALLPGNRPIVAAGAFLLCGAGFELLSAVLSPAALPTTAPPLRTSTVSIGARHAGLVLGLLVLAPVLSSSIEHGMNRAALSGTRTLLEAKLNTRDKIQVAWKLRDAIEQAPRGQAPDIPAVFDAAGAGHDPALTATRDQLMTTIEDAITRAFRPGFVVAALFGVLALVPALMVATPGTKTVRHPPRWLLAALCAGCVVLVVVEAGTGAGAVGEYHVANPCTASPDPYPGSGLDAAVQRIALSTLNGAACELHMSTEEMVLSLDRNSGYGNVKWDKATTERALRSGADRAINDAKRRGTLPGWAATALGVVVDHAPLDWFIGRLPFVTS
jgi:predicted MFS family arabinose efflux permease